MKCPRCETVVLEERERDGLVMDVCLTCRGIWLDRRDQARLIAQGAREFEEVTRSEPRPVGGGGRARQRHRDGDETGDYDPEDDGRLPRRQGHWWETLGGLFD